MRAHFFFQSVFALLLCLSVLPASGQSVGVGAIVRDFTIIDHATARPLQLRDFAGQIIVLDFFAHWCVPCRSASADLERNVRRYYAERGGNPARLPVVVIGINIDPGHPERADDFMRRTALDFTADDASHEAFGLFNEKNAVPVVVVINGAAGVAGRKQWELLYRKSGYEGATTLRTLIDSIIPSGSSPGEVRP